MFFLWVQCRGVGKGFYLPHVQNWSSHLDIGREITGGNSVRLPVSAMEGRYVLELPSGFTWQAGAEGEQLIEHCRMIGLSNGETVLQIYPARYEKKNTAMRKFAVGAETITIGSREDNKICYNEMGVSRSHASITRYRDGRMIFEDHSRFGSFVNGRYVGNSSQLLRDGDEIVILPSLRIVALGRYIAVNNTDILRIAPDLWPYTPEPMEEAGENKEEASVIYEYHRAPRHVQQPKQDKIDIDQPIERERHRELPVFLTVGPSFTMILPMLLSQMVNQGNRAMGSLVMIGTSSMLAVMWGSINRKYQKKQRELTEAQRQQVCRQYYAEMEERLQAATDRERNRLLYNYLSVSECASLPQENMTRLWERLPSHSDFLHMRLGLGECELPNPMDVKPNKISLTDDPLRHEPQRLYDQFHMMHDVPVMLDLSANQVLGILGDKEAPWMMQSLVLQAAANHSYHDVRICILHSKDDEEQWRFAKWLPHVFASDERTLRMVVSDEYAIGEVLAHIDSVLSMRAEMMQDKGEGEGEENTKLQLPWYLIFCTDPRILDERPIMRYLASSGLGFTLILQTKTMELLPKECKSVIEAKTHLGAVYQMNGAMTGVRYEAVPTERLEAFAHSLAPVRIKESMENSAIPSLVTFLETYNARKVEDLDIRYFWNENHAYNSVKARLGYKAGAVPFVLDISFKNHGPHGLIAGTTGAGKSVLLQTFILSLAINYSPTEVQFILIDYKGGGTSEDFKCLPHAAGIIDSLEGERMIYRALASVKGEILRREELFKEVGVNDIDDYMKLCNNDPTEQSLGHLVIIVDEFAELKQEKPEFMRELVSAARVGRSLGMHLVLATQKPSNSVSDEIDANTRFRICLRVASKSDSNEMLKRPEAAYIKGMGRGYVRVGSDEVFEQVQTSYPGAEYSPEALRPEEEPRILNAAGQPVKMKRKKNTQNKSDQKPMTQLDAVLKYLNDVCDQYHFDRARRMWLDELESILYLHQIPAVAENMFANGAWKEAPENELLAYFAMADDIQMQRYMPVAMNFTADKNQMVMGLSGMGKTTLLQTVAVSLAMRYSPAQVNIYVFSLTSRMLSCLSALPHVGDIVYEEDLDEQIRLMEFIHNECERRKKLFVEMSTDNYIQYNRAVKNAGHPEMAVPAIVVLIDRMQQLREWEEARKDAYLKMFYELLRSANSQGVYFVLTAFERNELPMKYQQYVHGISLQMNAKENYAEALAARIPPEWGGIRSYPGRGMIANVDKEEKQTFIYEIQTAIYATDESDAKRAECIRELGVEMKKAWKGACPKGIARIPAEPKLTDLIEACDMMTQVKAKGSLPFAYNKGTGETVSLDLRENFTMLAVGSRKSGKTNLLKNVASLFKLKQAQVYIIGGGELANWGRKHDMHAYEYGDPAWETEFMRIFKQEVSGRSDLLKQASSAGGIEARDSLFETFEPIVILIDDVDQYIEKYADKLGSGQPSKQQMYVYLKYFCAKNVSGYGIYTFATVSHSGYQKVRTKEFVTDLVAAKTGVMLQGKLNECDPFSVPVQYSKKNEVYPVGEGLFVNDNGTFHAVIPQWNEEKVE